MPTVVHFDIACDEPERAKKFYETVFDWKITAPPGMTDYYLIETTDLEGQTGVGGGVGKRGAPEQRISSYSGVDSVDKYLAAVERAGGKIAQPKMAVPGWGYLAMCLDTENNLFGLWQDDSSAK